MVGSKAARGQGHRHCAEQRRQQRHQVQKLFSPGQRGAELWAAAFQRLDAGTAHGIGVDLRLRPIDKAFDGAVLACHRQPVTQATGGLDQPGGLHIGLVDHDARCKIHEARAPVGLIDDDAAHLETAVTQQQVAAHRQPERIQQRRVNPGLTGLGNVTGQVASGIGLLGHAQTSTQGIAFGHDLQRHQLDAATGLVGRTRHGRESQVDGLLQTQCLDLRQEGGRDRVVADHHGIAPQQLARIALQTTLEPVGKKTDGGECGHRQRHSHHQQAQFTSTQITRQRAPTQLQK